MTQTSNQHGRGKYVKPDVKLQVLTEALSYKRYQMPKGDVCDRLATYKFSFLWRGEEGA